MASINNKLIVCKFPFYYCPFKLGVNPMYTKSFAENCNKYFMQYAGKYLERAPRHIWVDVNRFSKFLYPNCTDSHRLKVVTLISQFHGWIDDMLAYDWADSKRKSDLGVIILNQFKEIIDYSNGEKSINLMKWKPYIIGLYSVVKEVMDNYSPKQRKRFIDCYKIVIEGNNEEIKLFDKTNIEWNRELLIDQRSKSVGFYIYLQLIEYALDIELTDNEWNDPLLQNMFKECAKSTFLINDILSFRKEYMECNGDLETCSNLIAIYIVKEHMGLQEAFDSVRDLLVETDNKIFALEKQIMANESRVSDNLQKFMIELYYSVRGCWLYQIQSVRFHGEGLEYFVPLSGRFTFDPHKTIIEPDYDHPNKYECLKRYFNFD